MTGAERANVVLVRRLYETVNGGDAFRVLELLAPDVEWHAEAGGPLEDVHRGPDAVRRWIEEMTGAFEDWSMKPQRLVPCGACVVAPVEVRARATGTGIEVTGRIVHVWEIRDGRIAWTRSFPSEEEGLAAARAR